MKLVKFRYVLFRGLQKIKLHKLSKGLLKKLRVSCFTGLRNTILHTKFSGSK